MRKILKYGFIAVVSCFCSCGNNCKCTKEKNITYDTTKSKESIDIGVSSNGKVGISPIDGVIIDFDGGVGFEL